jgi:hypothetical protein
MSHMVSESYLNNYKNFSSKSFNYERNSNAVNEILSQAGPHNIYHRPGTAAEISNHTQITTEISHHPGRYNNYQYRINEDHNPVRLVRPITPVSLRQNVRIRHLEPPELPTPNPIIVQERQLTPLPPAPPVYIRQYQPAPPTPPTLVIRERPPVAPKMPETTYIEKIIPAPEPPARQVIIERIPAPERPRDVVYEKWLPYKPLPDRQVILERGRMYERQPDPKNIIIDYEQPRVNIDRRVYDEGVIRADPRTYSSMESYRNNAHEVRVVDRITDAPMANSSYSSYPVQTYSRPASTYNRAVTPLLSRPKTSSGPMIIGGGPKGPAGYNGPWNTTYRSSYNGKGRHYN